MPSHMGVQRQATERNEQIETLIDFVLQKFLECIAEEKYIEEWDFPIRQMRFERDDCSDVFDHYFEIHLIKPIKGVKGSIQIWGQTTCYKGNATGRPESNKTYEIRETLVESLGLRRALKEEGAAARTVHFTVGPANYTYGWFKNAKDNAFDLSLYPPSNFNIDDLVSSLDAVFAGTTAEHETHQRLEDALLTAKSPIRQLVINFRDRLLEWFLNGLPISPIADKQAELLNRLRHDQQVAFRLAIKASKNGGANIKGRVIALLAGDTGQSPDPTMARTIKRLNITNPFLPIAFEAEAEWPSWSKSNFAVPPHCSTTAQYIHHLWQSNNNDRLISRRLLLRIHTEESINYVQDIDIQGVTEHNLYGGTHTEAQAALITAQIDRAVRNAGIKSPQDLFKRLTSRHGLDLLVASRKLESINGTSMKPSFFYVEEALRRDYILSGFKEAGLPKPIAYHEAFGKARVDPYQNMKVVISRTLQAPVAIIKAKYFDRPEVPRRSKEEAYVGFTTKFRFDNAVFTERYKGYPLIMFVDMDTELQPPEFAIKRLVTAGWEVFFSIEALKDYLDELSARRSSRER